MTEDEFQAAIVRERVAAWESLERALLEWRRELWPDPYTDPIGRENRARRFRAEIAAQAYWGAGVNGRLIYGGICAG